MWHKVHGKDFFDKGKLYKVARAIIGKGLPGTARLKMILKMSSKAIDPRGDDGLFPIEEDMPNRVAGVKALISGQVAFSFFDKSIVRGYLKKIAPRHLPPYRQQRLRILECLIDVAQKELKKIIDERRAVLGTKCCSISIDFWTCSHRKQCFGCIIVDLQANKYTMTNGESMFMSKGTFDRLSKRDGDLFIDHEGVLSDLEYPLNFEQFNDSKTSANVSLWVKESTDEVGIKSDDINVTTADGASNAIGSLVDFELLTRDERSDNQEFEICAAHQNQRSADFASGKGGFAENSNPELSACLNFSHKHQVRLSSP